jgi:DNA-binding GntR family transcriptional regulator
MAKGITTELQRPVPLYMQVVRQLRAQIAAGDLAEGDRIPSQREMMQRWRISMQTASKVIGALKTEGLAIASIGRDTIVAPGAANRIAAAAQGTLHAPAEPEPGPEVTVNVTAGQAAAPAHIAEILGIPAGRRALRRQETRTDNGQAVSVTTAWFPQDIAEKAPRLTGHQPLPAGALAYVVETTGNHTSCAVEESAATGADEATAKALGVRADAPVLLIRARYYTSTGQIVSYTETSVPAGHWHARNYAIIGR